MYDIQLNKTPNLKDIYTLLSMT